MGTENNECVIATTSNKKAMADLKEYVNALDEPMLGPVRLQVRSLVHFIPGIINGVCTVVVAPDGSNKGWPEADLGDSVRAKIIDRIKSHDYEDGSNPFAWIEVGYGEYGQKILRGNCTNQFNDKEYAIE